MLRRTLRFLCAVAICTTYAYAQVTTGTILGSVHDSSGANVADAQVTITDLGKGTTQTVQTDASGNYIAPYLTPGNYQVAVERSGFKRQVSNPFQLEVDQKARMDFTLQIGQVSETIEVQATAPLVRSETSELGEVITERAVRDLPLNGRNFAQLVYLVPGVTPGQSGENLSGASTFNPRAASNFNALGSQANANGWLVDGIVDNEYTFNTVMVQPSVESVQEFKVLTGTFSAEYGRGAGVVTTQTKSGSNQLHGSAFDYLRNNFFDARAWRNVKPQVQPPYRRNQYGASLGGPIIKNKVFVFGDYYGQREIKGQTFYASVPTAQEHTGDFSDLIVGGKLVPIYNPFTTTKDASGKISRQQFTGNKIPSNLIDAVGANLMSLYPLPNVPGAGLTDNYVEVLNRDLKDNGGNIRIDYKMSDKDSLFGRYSFEQFLLFDTKGQSGCCIRTPSTVAGKFDLGPFVSGGQNTNLAASGFAFNETHIFTPTLINEFIAGYARTNPYTTQSDFGHNAAASLGIQGINITQFSTGIPTIVPGTAPGLFDVQALNGGPGFLPAHPRQTSYQIQEGVSWILGSHTVKLGYRVVKNLVSPFTNTDTRSTLNFANNLTNNPQGGTGGSGFATMLLGYLANGTSAGGSRGLLLSPYYMTNWEHSAWVQDDWKVNPRLTLNLGLRWDLFTPDTEQNNRLTNFDPVNLTMVYAGVNGVSDTAGKKTQWHNFGPRFGFAYDMFGSGKWVARGGYGVAYFQEQASASNLLGQAVPWTISQNTPTVDLYPLDMTAVPKVENPFGPPVPVEPTTTADLIKTNPRVLGHSFENQTPYYETWNFDMEHQIGESIVTEIAYAGSRGIHLLYCYNPQEVEPGPSSVPASQRVTIPAIASVRNILQCDERNMSNYHSVQGKITKRFSQGLQFLGSYTYGKSLDYGGSAASGGGQDGGIQTITNFKAGYGPSGFDVRHRFVGSWVYEVPLGPGRRWLNSGLVGNLFGGWEVDGISTVQTGRPFNVTMTSNVTNGSNSWPNRVGDGKIDHPTPDHWFDPTAFAAPTCICYGNVARGVLYGPGTVDFDLSAAKNFAIHERYKFQFRVDAFNAFNHPLLGFPNATINSSNPAATATRITSTQGTSADNRDLQLSLKLMF